MSLKSSILVLILCLPTILSIVWFDDLSSQTAYPLSRVQESDVASFEIISGVVSTKAERRISDSRVFDYKPHWFVSSLADSEVDQSAVNATLTQLSMLRLERLPKAELVGAIERKDIFSASSLAVHVKVDDGRSFKLQFGMNSEYLGQTYMRVEGESDVYLVSSDVAETFRLGADLFKRRTPFDDRIFNTKRIRLVRSDGELTLEQKFTAGEPSQNASWAVSFPFSRRANSASIDALIRHLRSLRIGRFLPKGTRCENQSGEMGLRQPLSMELQYIDGSISHTVTSRFFAPVRAASDKGGVGACVEHSDYSSPIILAAGDPLQTLGQLGNYLPQPFLLGESEVMLKQLKIRADTGVEFVLSLEAEGRWLVDGDESDEPFVRDFLSSVYGFSPLSFLPQDEEEHKNTGQLGRFPQLSLVGLTKDGNEVRRTLKVIGKMPHSSGAQTMYQAIVDWLPARLVLDDKARRGLFPSREVLLKAAQEG